MGPLRRVAPLPDGRPTPGGPARAVVRVHGRCGSTAAKPALGLKTLRLPECFLPCPTRIWKRSRGFTLVELLLAIAVMGLLAILSWRGLDGMVRAQEITRQRADELLVLQAALGQWGTDLDALQPLPDTTALDWDGQVLRITRRSSAVPDEGALVVAWTRRGLQGTGQWVRWQSPPVRTIGEWQDAWQRAARWAQNPGDDERRAELVLLPLADWQIFYHRGGAWSNPLSSDGTPVAGSTAGNPAGNPAGSSGASAVPDGVRLQITLAPGQALAGRLTRDWVNPILTPGRT